MFRDRVAGLPSLCDAERPLSGALGSGCWPAGLALPLPVWPGIRQRAGEKGASGPVPGVEGCEVGEEEAVLGG